MIYVYRRHKSTGARLLAEALGGRRWSERFPRTPRQGDVVVCWGESLAPPNGVRVINGAPLQNKFDDAIKLREAGVPTIEVSRTRPVARQAATPVDPVIALADEFIEDIRSFRDAGAALFIRRNQVQIDALAELVVSANRLQGALMAPAPVAPPAAPVGEWVGRRNNHVGGLDLLRPPAQPDYWVKKETFVREFRVHSFLGKSIRAGVKAIRDGFTAQTASTWVRSWDGGWWIRYDGDSVRNVHRDIAHRAVAALGLQFGAVDIGERADGSLVVLEVNRAPGVEGGSLAAYEKAITAWAGGRA